MTKYNWNYEELGFKSEKEMKESIARVTERMNNPKNEIELEIERMNELNTHLKANNNQLDTTRLRKEARLQELDITVHNLIIHEREEAKRKAEQEKLQKLFKAAGESIALEKEAEAQRELQKEKEKAVAELQQEMFSKYGVKSDKEKELDEAYSKLLGD